MKEEYDQITAFHYSAFRPALHLPILQECLGKRNEYAFGLDVGCGTGQSAIALTNFCEKVVGIDPSKEMLAKAIAYPGITYQHFDGLDFSFPKNYYDLITFAGSLYYAKSQQLLDEVIRVGKEDAQVVVYDFELLLDPFWEKLKVNSKKRTPSNYDHEVNFSGLDEQSLKIEKQLNKSIALEISIENIVHLLLSSKDNYSLLFEAFGGDDLYEKIRQELQAIFPSGLVLVVAKTFATLYRLVK